MSIENLMPPPYGKLMGESVAAANLEECLKRLADGLVYPKPGSDDRVGIAVFTKWTPGPAYNDFLQYVARRVSALLPTLHTDWLDSLHKDVEAARANLAEIQARK